MPKPVQWLAKSAFMKFVMKRMGVTQGSLAFSGPSLARVAAHPAYANASGNYFQSNDGKLIEARSSKMFYEKGRAKKLWNDSKTARPAPARRRSTAAPVTTDKKLIVAASALRDSGGEEAVTLRAVAHASGISHNAPYKHLRAAMPCWLPLQPQILSH